MNDPTILFVKPGAINADDKAVLKSVDVIVVEVEDPKAIKFVRANAELESTEMLTAACAAIMRTPIGNYASHVRTAFGEAVMAAILAKRPAPSVTKPA